MGFEKEQRSTVAAKLKPGYFLSWLALVALCVTWGCDEAEEMLVPTVFVVAGQVADPTTNPPTELPGAVVTVETATSVAAVTTDANGFFIIQGMPLGTHRLRAELSGRRPTISINLEVNGNITDVGLPLFTDAQIDSILLARGAPPWDRQLGLFGLFALRSTGSPMGDANVQLSPGPGGNLIQTGNSEDPLVWVNAAPGNYSMEVTRSGIKWRNPYSLTLRGGTLAFATPVALPNINGFLFSNRLTGAAVSGANAGVFNGQTQGSTTTDFLGQFNLIGLEPGKYDLRMTKSGFLSTLTWPHDVSQDTTISHVIIERDTLESWSMSAGGPTLDPTGGYLVADLRDQAGGASLVGATLGIEQTGAGGISIAQSATRPALLVNVVPGLYNVIVQDAMGMEIHRRDEVWLRAGEATFTRLEL